MLLLKSKKIMMNPIHIIYNYHFFIRVKIESMKAKHFTQAVVGADLRVRPPDRESL